MYQEYVGNLHIHSKHSDGTATIEEIAVAAERARLDFVGINDHFKLTGLKEGKEGWHNGVAVLIGTELNNRYNHFLAYNIREEIPSDTSNPQNVIDATNKQGGLGFIAHPFELGSPLHDGGHAFEWTRWDAQNYTGICIWNFSSIWKGNVRNHLQGFYYYCNMAAPDLDPLDATLAKWDELIQRGKVVAIGGSDNHGVKFSFLLGLVRGRLFDYEYAFRAVNTHILLPEELPDDFEAARGEIYGALRAGRCFIGNGLFADPRGFRFEAEASGGRVPMGGEARLSDSPVVLHVEAPSRGIIRFIHRGRLLKSESAKEATHRVDEPGPYRVEVRLPDGRRKSRAWIFSNPIYVV